MGANEGVTEFSVFSNDNLEPSQENITLSQNDDSGFKNDENVNGVPLPMDEKAVEEDLRMKILEKLQNSPKKGFRIVQEWLDEMESQAAQG